MTNRNYWDWNSLTLCFRNSWIMLNGNETIKLPCFIPDSRTAYTISLLRIIFGLKFQYMVYFLIFWVFLSMSEFELYDMISLNKLSTSSVFLMILSIDAESFIMMKQPWISRLLAIWHDSLYFYVLEVISVLKIWRQKMS